MTLLHRQLFREIASIFCLTLMVLLGLLIIGRAVQLRDVFLGLDIGLFDTLILFAYMIPVSLMLLIPIACMASVFLAFLRMSTDRELVALRAAGVSVLQMLQAPLLFSVLCTVLSLWVSLFWLGWGMGQFRTTLLDIATTRARIVVQPGIFNVDFPGLTLFARQVHPETGRMTQILVDDRTNPEREILMLAPAGTIDMDYERGDVVFSLENGNIYSLNDQGASVLSFEGYQVRLPMEKLFKTLAFSHFRPQDMTWAQLAIEGAKAKALDQIARINRIEVEQHKRFAYPMACLVLALFAIPLAVAFEGLHRQTGMMLALGMFFVYYFLMSLGFSTGEVGSVPPYIGLWAPNILFLFGGIYGVWLTYHERVPQIITWVRSMRTRKKGLAAGVTP